MTQHPDLTLDVALGLGRQKNITHWQNNTVGWWKVVEQAEKPASSKESAGSWLFGKLRPTPEISHAASGCTDPCPKLHRNMHAVVSRSAVALDADHATPDFPDRVRDMGIEALVHPTYSSTADAPRYRVLMPASREMTPEEYTRVADEVMRRLTRDGDADDMWDRSANQASRLMYKPATPDPSSYRTWHFTGPLLDVDMTLLDAALEEPEREVLEGVIYDDATPLSEQEIAKAERTLAKAVACAPSLTRPDGGLAPGRNEWVKDWGTPLLGLTKAGALDRDAVADALWEATLTAPGDDTWDRAEFDGVLASVWGYTTAQRPEVEKEADVFDPIPTDERGVAVREEEPLRIGRAYPPSEPMPNARLFLKRCPQIRRWRGGWYVYRDGVYVARSDEWLRAVAFNVFEDAFYITGAGTPNEKRMQWSPSTSSINTLLDALGAVVMVDDDVEPDRSRINFTNGLLDVATGTLEPHSDEVFSVVQLPFAYDPGASCPDWLVFLKDALEGDADSIALMQEMFGYVVSGRTDMQKIFYLFGPRRAGKGVTLRVLTSLVGEANVASPTVTSYAKDFGLASLIGKTLATTADARFGKTTDIQTVTERWLTISGEDRISVPRKFREDWVGTLGARIVVASNETPPFRDSSAAVVSRLVLVRFRNSYLDREDTGLTERLLRELPGILNWALAGLDRLRSRGRFTEPQTSLDLARDMEDESSPMTAFIREYCVVGSEEKVACTDFIDSFNWWMAERGDPNMSNRAVGMALRSAHPKVDVKFRNDEDGKSVRHYVGIGWTTDLLAKAAAARRS